MKPVSEAVTHGIRSIAYIIIIYDRNERRRETVGKEYCASINRKVAIIVSTHCSHTYTYALYIFAKHMESNVSTTLYSTSYDDM